MGSSVQMQTLLPNEWLHLNQGLSKEHLRIVALRLVLILNGQMEGLDAERREGTVLNFEEKGEKRSSCTEVDVRNVWQKREMTNPPYPGQTSPDQAWLQTGIWAWHCLLSLNGEKTKPGSGLCKPGTIALFGNVVYSGLLNEHFWHVGVPLVTRLVSS
ncbi:hypothetical protein PAMA_012878 [Pampus argenteus]